MREVNVIFDLLGDSKWHSLTEIAERTGLHEFKLEIITSFLVEYDFVELDKTKHQVRLAASVVDFLKKIRRIERDEG